MTGKVTMGHAVGLEAGRPAPGGAGRGRRAINILQSCSRSRETSQQLSW